MINYCRLYQRVVPLYAFCHKPRFAFIQNDITFSLPKRTIQVELMGQKTISSVKPIVQLDSADKVYLPRFRGRRVDGNTFRAARPPGDPGREAVDRSHSVTSMTGQYLALYQEVLTC